MITAIVQFELPKPVSLEEAARMFESTAPKYQNLPGLIRKYYLRSRGRAHRRRRLSVGDEGRGGKSLQRRMARARRQALRQRTGGGLFRYAGHCRQFPGRRHHQGGVSAKSGWSYAATPVVHRRALVLVELPRRGQRRAEAFAINGPIYMTKTRIDFDAPDIAAQAERASLFELDHLPFGVIRLDREGTVQFYNSTEARLSGYGDIPIGKNLFAISDCLGSDVVPRPARTRDGRRPGRSRNRLGRRLQRSAARVAHSRAVVAQRRAMVVHRAGRAAGAEKGQLRPARCAAQKPRPCKKFNPVERLVP